MFLFKIILSSLGSIVILFILTKIMGNREMAQLSMFDYINSITIGSIAAEMATSLENDFVAPMTAMIVYGISITLISILSNKSIKARRFISGPSLVLLSHGKLHYYNFNKAKIDINEFLVQCRTAGYFNLTDIDTAILEPNGKISFLEGELSKPITAQDLNLESTPDSVIYNLIIDGKILENNLNSTGNNIKWLEKELKNQKVKSINDVFLATCDNNNNLTVYLKNTKENTKDPFI